MAPTQRSSPIKRPLAYRQPASKVARRRRSSSSHHTESDLFDSDSVASPNPPIDLSSDSDSDISQDAHELLHAIMARNSTLSEAASSVTEEEDGDEGDDGERDHSRSPSVAIISPPESNSIGTILNDIDGDVGFIMPTLPLNVAANHGSLSPTSALLGAGLSDAPSALQTASILDPGLVESQSSDSNGAGSVGQDSPPRAATSPLPEEQSSALIGNEVENQLGLLPTPMRRRGLYYPGMDLNANYDDMRNLSAEELSEVGQTGPEEVGTDEAQRDEDIENVVGTEVLDVSDLYSDEGTEASTRNTTDVEDTFFPAEKRDQGTQTEATDAHHAISMDHRINGNGNIAVNVHLGSGWSGNPSISFNMGSRKRKDVEENKAANKKARVI